MDLFNKEEFRNYVKENYVFLGTTRKGGVLFDGHYADRCEFCQRDAYLKIYYKWHYGYKYHDFDSDIGFTTILVKCPSCSKVNFILNIAVPRFVEDHRDDDEHEYDGDGFWEYDHYKIVSVPAQESDYMIQEIPNKYSNLISTLKEAKYVLDHGQYISGTIMYRRGLQILVKEILGANGPTLEKQLNWLKSNSNNLNIDLTELFHDNGKLIRQVGNQGAHPDDDPDLHVFSESDAKAVHDLFMELINAVFIIPAKMKSLKEDLKSRRKLK